MDDGKEMTEAVAELNRQELIRHWELLFWTFLLFGFGRYPYSDWISLGVR